MSEGPLEWEPEDIAFLAPRMKELSRESCGVILSLFHKNREFIRHFTLRRRCWLSIYRTEVSRAKDALAELFECQIGHYEIKPAFEHVFYDQDESGNSYEELLYIARARSERS